MICQKCGTQSKGRFCTYCGMPLYESEQKTPHVVETPPKQEDKREDKRILHPYYNNLIKRAVKTPKLYFTDAGLCAHLLGISTADAAIASPASGALLETYVVMEIMKSHWYSGSDAQFWFFRDAAGHEVDLVIEHGGGLYPVEIKRATAVKAVDIRRNMDVFRATTGPSASTGAVVLVSRTFGALDATTALIPVGAL